MHGLKWPINSTRIVQPGSGEFRVVEQSAAAGYATKVQFAPTAADGPPQYEHGGGLWSAALASSGMRQLIVLAGATDVTISDVALAHTRMDCPNHQPTSTNPAGRPGWSS